MLVFQLAICVQFSAWNLKNIEKCFKLKAQTVWVCWIFKNIVAEFLICLIIYLDFSLKAFNKFYINLQKGFGFYLLLGTVSATVFHSPPPQMNLFHHSWSELWSLSTILYQNQSNPFKVCKDGCCYTLHIVTRISPHQPDSAGISGLTIPQYPWVKLHVLKMFLNVRKEFLHSYQISSSILRFSDGFYLSEANVDGLGCSDKL